MPKETILIWVLVGIVVALLLRELLCWFWKINEAVTLLKEIDSKLSKLILLNQNVDVPKERDTAIPEEEDTYVRIPGSKKLEV